MRALLAMAMTLTAGAASAQCDICDVGARLDQARATCFLARYDALAKAGQDPIMVDLSKCEGVARTGGSRGPGDVLADGPKPKPMSTVMILQRRTLDCLSAKLRGLPKDVTWPYEVVFEQCPNP